jgi:hypothetical protein
VGNDDYCYINGSDIELVYHEIVNENNYDDYNYIKRTIRHWSGGTN